MDLEALSTFAAIANTGSLTKAAGLLHLSPPAASARLRALEAEIGFSLFVRATQGMSLTPQGREFLPTVTEFLLQARSVSEKARSLALGRQRLRLGVIAHAELTRVGPLTGLLLAGQPALELSLSTALSGQIWQDVDEGLLDAGLCLDMRGKTPCTNLDFMPLTSVPHALICAATQDVPAASDVAGCIRHAPFLATASTCSLHVAMARLFAAYGLNSPLPLAEADSEDLLVDMVAQGHGLAIVREVTAQVAQARGHVHIWPAPVIELAFGRVCKNASSSPEGKRLDDALTRLWT